MLEVMSTISIYGESKNAVVVLLQSNSHDYNNNNLYNISLEEQVILVLILVVWISKEHWKAISIVKKERDSNFVVLIVT